MEKERLILRNISRTDRLFHNYIRSECEKIGINSSFQGIIRILSRENGLSQLELAKRLVLSAPTISLTLQKMEYLGYISRRQDTTDARITRVYLTEEGFKMDDKIKALFRKLEERINLIVSEEEHDVILKILESINQEIITLEEEESK